MKSISMFIMILICMVSFTSTATTAKMEQKQKTEFVKTFNVESNEVSVVNEINAVSVTLDAAIKTEFKAKSFEVIDRIAFESINDDVGWQISNQLFNKINYQEKLKCNLLSKDNPIRYCRGNC